MAFLRALPTCGCGAPARATLVSERNADLAHLCWRCGRRALKAQQRIERGDRERARTPVARGAESAAP